MSAEEAKEFGLVDRVLAQPPVLGDDKDDEEPKKSDS